MDIINGFKRSDLKASIAPERFHLILFPTEQCNFRCVYCYEDFSVGQMPDWLVDATKQLLQRKIPKLSMLNLSWFGGEPLLAKKTVLELARYADDLCQQHDCMLSGDMTTNGALLDVPTLKSLVALRQNRFQISIDGAKEAHNSTRLTRTGRGSFDKIWSRLCDAAATDLDFRFTLRVHVTAFNQQSVAEFCQLYQAHFAEDPRFSLFFKAIEDLGGANQDKILPLIDMGKPRAAAAAFQAQYNPKAASANYICYASKPNSLAIRANGALNKCTVALQDDVNQIGRINPDGTLEVDQQKFSSWTQGFIGLDAWKMGCPHGYMEANKKPPFSSDINIIEVA